MYIDPKSAQNITTASTPTVSHLNSQGRQPAQPAEERPDGVQLSHLSSVLNGLAAGASADAKHISTLSALFKAGAYKVDSVQVSQRIVDDALRPD